MRIKLVVAYDGTDFRGWARQAGTRSVQQTLTDTITRVCGQEAELIGASRTDSGAHAEGQVCHFDTAVAIRPAEWPRILNRALPDDLKVKVANEVAPDFHARFCADYRHYRYRIRMGAPDPFLSRWTFFHGRPIDLCAIQEAAGILRGTHDFRAFTEELDPRVDNTVRTLHRVQVERSTDEEELRIEIEGTAFLRGMMRRISGALLEVGRGYRPPEDITSLLRDRGQGMRLPVVLPAKGLCLMHVQYGNPPHDCRGPRPENGSGT